MAVPHAPDPSFSTEGLLAESGWFPLLSATSRSLVRGAVREIALESGEAVSHQGELPHAWCGVLEGLVKLSSVTVEGRPVTFTGLAPGAWFGEATLLRDAPFSVDAVALRPSRVLRLPSDVFFHLLEADFPFSRYIMTLLGERLHWFMGHSHHRANESQARVTRAVVGLFQPAACVAKLTELRISQEELANIAGVSRQSCNSALKKLCEDELLEIDYGIMRLRDPVRLRKLVD